MASVALFVSSLTQALEALQLLRSSPLGRAVHSVTLSDSQREVSVDIFTQLLLQCPNVRSITLTEWSFRDVGVAHIEQMAAPSSPTFSCLTELHIGGKGVLSISSFFRLLSVMPSLRTLRIGNVFDPISDSDSDGEDEDGTQTRPNATPEDDEPFATPACSLKELLVTDDWGIDFKHYPHLLSNSHDTLEHLELSWIFNSEVETTVLEAIAPCSRLRSLELIGNDFSPTRIIAACPGLQCLSLERAPNDDEIAALPQKGRTLHELRLIYCSAVYHDDGFIGEYWPELERLLPSLPALRTLRLVMKGNADERCPASYPLASAECRRRCIRLLTELDGYDWVM